MGGVALANSRGGFHIAAKEKADVGDGYREEGNVVVGACACSLTITPLLYPLPPMNRKPYHQLRRRIGKGFRREESEWT